MDNIQQTQTPTPTPTPTPTQIASRRMRNLLAAARSREKKAEALKAAQAENASLRQTNSMLMGNIALLKDKLFHTDETFKENKKMNKIIKQMRERIRKLSEIILNF